MSLKRHSKHLLNELFSAHFSNFSPNLLFILCKMSVDKDLFQPPPVNSAKKEIHCLRQNHATQASILDRFNVACGAFKNVKMCVYTIGNRMGELCVRKVFKDREVFEDSYFTSELEVTTRAAQIVEAFNRLGITKDVIAVNEPTIWHSMDDRKERCLVEPYIQNFQVRVSDVL